MTAHDHAAQLAEALRSFTDVWDSGKSFLKLDVDEIKQIRDNARAALAAWDKHNAQAPKQEALL